MDAEWRQPVGSEPHMQMHERGRGRRRGRIQAPRARARATQPHVGRNPRPLSLRQQLCMQPPTRDALVTWADEGRTQGPSEALQACSPLQSPTQAHSKSHQRELDVRSRPRDERLRNAPRHRPSIDPRARAEAPELNGNQAHQKHLDSTAIRLISGNQAHQKHLGSTAIRLIRSTWAHQWQSGSSVAIISGTH